MAVPFAACMALIASLYNLPPRVLPSIHVVEGGQASTVHLNRDGSEDLGYMQVATVRQNLLTRPCFNIAAAGLILRVYLDETKGNLMLAVGDYHSHTPQLNSAYQQRVVNSAMSLFAGKG
jgi:hypothetical protein